MQEGSTCRIGDNLGWGRIKKLNYNKAFSKH